MITCAIVQVAIRVHDQRESGAKGRKDKRLIRI